MPGHWIAGLNKLANAKDKALALTSQTVYDRYQKYLTGCAEQFRKGTIDVRQFCMRSLYSPQM